MNDEAMLAHDESATLPGGQLRRTVLISLTLATAVTLVTGWVWTRVPADARIPTHWNASGQADGFGGRSALFLLPVLLWVLTLVFALLPRIEPRGRHLLRSATAFTAVWLAILAILTLVQAAILLTALGLPVTMPRIVFAGVGGLLLVTGNYLGKLRSNFFVGVRTPWTLSSELSWNKTHRLTGRLFVAYGAILLTCGLATTPGPHAHRFLLAGLIAVVVIASAYSYAVWRRDPDRHPAGRNE